MLRTLKPSSPTKENKAGNFNTWNGPTLQPSTGVQPLPVSAKVEFDYSQLTDAVNTRKRIEGDLRRVRAALAKIAELEPQYLHAKSILEKHPNKQAELKQVNDKLAAFARIKRTNLDLEKGFQEQMRKNEKSFASCKRQIALVVRVNASQDRQEHLKGEIAAAKGRQQARGKEITRLKGVVTTLREEIVEERADQSARAEEIAAERADQAAMRENIAELQRQAAAHGERAAAARARQAANIEQTVKEVMEISGYEYGNPEHHEQQTLLHNLIVETFLDLPGLYEKINTRMSAEVDAAPSSCTPS